MDPNGIISYRSRLRLHHRCRRRCCSIWIARYTRGFLISSLAGIRATRQRRELIADFNSKTRHSIAHSGGTRAFRICLDGSDKYVAETGYGVICNAPPAKIGCFGLLRETKIDIFEIFIRSSSSGIDKRAERSDDGLFSFRHRTNRSTF